MLGVSDLKVFISVDIEGVSGIVHQSETHADPAEYEKGRALMAGDVNAAIEGALSIGGTEIVVCDGHATHRNLNPEALHESAWLVRGSPKPLTQMEGIDNSFDAVLFVGYHAKRGTRYGILDHTIDPTVIDRMLINGLEVGETGINAGLAGYYGVPLLFISGDLAVTKEAKALIPNITVVTVKEAVSRTSAKCLSPKKTRELIKKGVIEALKKRESVKPFTFNSPIDVEIKYTDPLMADVAESMPFIERIDGRTVRFTLYDYVKAFRAMRACIWITKAWSR